MSRFLYTLSGLGLGLRLVGFCICCQQLKFDCALGIGQQGQSLLAGTVRDTNNASTGCCLLCCTITGATGLGPNPNPIPNPNPALLYNNERHREESEAI